MINFEDLDEEFIFKWTRKFDMFEKNLGKFYCHWCNKNVASRCVHASSELHILHCLQYVKHPENYYIPQND